MNPLLLATVLNCTLPAFNADIPPNRLKPQTCAESVMPCSDLSRLEVWGVPACPGTWTDDINYKPRIIADFDVRGREGQPISFVFDDQGLTWSCWVTTKDFAGNESCRSNQIGVNMGPGIPDPSAPPPERP